MRARPVINLVTKRIRHHATASGYDRLVDFLDAGVIDSTVEWTLAQRVIARVFRPLISGSGTQWYHRDDFITELRVARRWMRASNEIFHFLYGENMYRYCGLLRSISHRNSIVCTYHTPQSRFSEVIREHGHLARADAIVVVSTVQRDFLEHIVGDDKVFYVPHGVDVEFFHPLESTANSARDDELTCLAVGGHLRDFETLAAAHRLIIDMTRDVRLVVVAPEQNHCHFDGLDNVELRTNVPDDMLLALYQQADVFIMPMQDCTANNAILEAMACGLPIVCTDLQGARDYVDTGCAVLTPKSDADALASSVLRLREDADVCVSMGRASRDRALDFRWEEVAQQMLSVYERVRDR